MMDKIDFYRRQIKNHYPQLSLQDVVLNQAGQYNDVLIVDRAWVFRFAKVPDAIKTLQQEITLLHTIQSYITLAIPDPIYNHVATNVVGETFMGYRMIPGKPLWMEAFTAITEPKVRQRMAVQLGVFLHELHYLPIQKISPQLPPVDTYAEWADLYQRIQVRLFPYMRPEARREVARHFEDFLDDPSVYRFQPALRHGDFGTGNLIFDPEVLSIVGIIDFGGAGIGDPAVDFAGLYNYGEAFYQHCYSVYPAMEQALPRVHFYRGTFALQEALFGIEHGDNQAFQNGIADYQ
jgi:aminoglycoside 2''-phosphotransferase